MILYSAILILIVSSICVLLHRYSDKKWIYLLIGLTYPALAFLLVFLCSNRFFEILSLWGLGFFLGLPAVSIACFIGAIGRFKLIAFFCFCISVLNIGIGFYAFVFEPQNLAVRKEVIVSNKLKRKIRVVVLADLQTDQVGDFQKLVLTKTLEQKPDLILFAGDYIQSLPNERDKNILALNRLMRSVNLRATMGIFVVRGDQDQYDGWQRIFEKLPVKIINDTTTVQLDDITITGLSRNDSEFLKSKVAPCDNFHIILGHLPDFSLYNPPADLLVAGHTHGGQVQMPSFGPLLTYSRGDRISAGGCFKKLANDRYLLISRGIGMERGEAPRLRFWCRPEIVVVDLIPGN